MRLYHGTSVTALDSILANGILPRSEEKVGNWGHTILSRPGVVYLTDTYPFYFAHSAMEGDDAALVLAVEIDENALLPDEDFLGQVVNRTNGQDVFEATEEHDCGANRHLWAKSLELLGTVCYEGIVKPAEIVEYVIVEDWSFLSVAVDCSISLENHRFCAEKYKSLIALAFGEIDEYWDPILVAAGWASIAPLTIDPEKIKRVTAREIPRST